MAQIGIRGAQGQVYGEGLKALLYERRKVLLGLASVIVFLVFWEGTAAPRCRGPAVGT